MNAFILRKILEWNKDANADWRQAWEEFNALSVAELKGLEFFLSGGELGSLPPTSQDFARGHISVLKMAKELFDSGLPDSFFDWTVYEDAVPAVQTKASVYGGKVAMRTFSLAELARMNKAGTLGKVLEEERATARKTNARLVLPGDDGSKMRSVHLNPNVPYEALKKRNELVAKYKEAFTKGDATEQQFNKMVLSTDKAVFRIYDPVALETGWDFGKVTSPSGADYYKSDEHKRHQYDTTKVLDRKVG